MKKDQFIPHDVTMRTNSEIMRLIQKEGIAGYGIYWAMMEYLRTQDDYTGDVRVFGTLARQLRTSPARLKRILHDYGLFEVTNNAFQSCKLNTVMRRLEDKRKAMVARSCDEHATNVQREARNSLETNDEFSLSIEEDRLEEDRIAYTTSPESSSSAEAVAAVAAKTPEETQPVSFVPAWERYVDELREDEQWKELMAMRTGLKQQFYTLFPRIVESFKRHVRMLGNEGQILSPSEAKRYFCFYLDPGSVTFKRLWEELHKPIDRGKYKHEDHDPTTGQRSYCGVPIPADAPPRPNGQAVWCDGKWVF